MGRRHDESTSRPLLPSPADNKIIDRESYSSLWMLSFRFPRILACRLLCEPSKTEHLNRCLPEFLSVLATKVLPECKVWSKVSDAGAQT